MSPLSIDVDRRRRTFHLFEQCFARIVSVRERPITKHMHTHTHTFNELFLVCIVSCDVCDQHLPRTIFNAIKLFFFSSFNSFLLYFIVWASSNVCLCMRQKRSLDPAPSVSVSLSSTFSWRNVFFTLSCVVWQNGDTIYVVGLLSICTGIISIFLNFSHHFSVSRAITSMLNRTTFNLRLILISAFYCCCCCCYSFRCDSEVFFVVTRLCYRWLLSTHLNTQEATSCQIRHSTHTIETWFFFFQKLCHISTMH